MTECIIASLQWTTTFGANWCEEVNINSTKHHHYQANDRHRHRAVYLQKHISISLMPFSRSAHHSLHPWPVEDCREGKCCQWMDSVPLIAACHSSTGWTVWVTCGIASLTATTAPFTATQFKWQHVNWKNSSTAMHIHNRSIDVNLAQTLTRCFSLLKYTRK